MTRVEGQAHLSSLSTPSLAAMRGITIREISDYGAQLRDVIGGASTSRAGTSAAGGAGDQGKGVITEVIPETVDSDKDISPPPAPKTDVASISYFIPRTLEIFPILTLLLLFSIGFQMCRYQTSGLGHYLV